MRELFLYGVLPVLIVGGWALVFWSYGRRR